MALFLYAPTSPGLQEWVMKALKPLVPGTCIEVYRTINDLSRRLRAPKEDVTVAVLLIASREDLLDLLSIRSLFRDVRIILVLPDTEDETIAMAHRLRPRYLTYIDGNFPAFASVLHKMLEGGSKLH